VNFLLDQDVPERVGDVLRHEGRSVTPLRDAFPINTADDLVLQYASEHELILVSCNRDDFLALALHIRIMALLCLFVARVGWRNVLPS